MKLLALETSSSTGSVALDDGRELVERHIARPREQTDRILPLVEALLADAGLELGALDAIVFGRGPGSFTGLRIAAAVAQGLALAADRPLIPVSSLAGLAQRAWREHGIARALCCVDARMGEVYWGSFEVRAARARPLDQERLSAPERVTAPGGGLWSGLGSGFAAQAEALAALKASAERVLDGLEPLASDLLPQARADFEARRFTSVAAAQPVYLRDETAWKRQ